MTKGDQKLEEAYIEDAPRGGISAEDEQEQKPDERSLDFIVDMRVYYRRMASQTDEIYRRRKHEVMRGGVSEDVRAEEMANRANAALAKIKRGAYKEWCDAMDTILLNLAMQNGVSKAPKIRNKNTEEAVVEMAYKSLTANALAKIAEYVGVILAQFYVVDVCYKEFIRIAGEEE